MRVRCFVAATVMICSSCSPRKQLGPDAPALRTGVPEPTLRGAGTLDTVEVLDTGPGRAPIADGEMNLIPDPAARTWMRLAGLRAIVREFTAKHGRLPDRMEEFMPAPGTEWIDYRFDGWSDPITYARRGQGFEIRSAGPDGRVGTSDDLVVTRESVIPNI